MDKSVEIDVDFALSYKKEQGRVLNLAWVLPRPKRDHYKGGFPLWFEEKLLRFFGIDLKDMAKDEVIQLFSGMTKYGFRVDLSKEVKPDLICDCHKLPKEWNNRWDIAICDPPYNDEYSKKLYGTGKIKYKDYISEAVRIVEPGGFICSYHWAMTPRPDGTDLIARIFVGTRTWHKPRICNIFQKHKKMKPNPSNNTQQID